MKNYSKEISEKIKQMTIEEKVSQLTNSAAGIERLNIKKYNWWNEALHGVARAGKATVFPQAIGLAATWDEDLLAEIATAISIEGRAKYNKAKEKDEIAQYHGLTYWSPNINIFRDPRWGRGQETYGEDPYLTGKLACAFIENLQNNGAKHLRAAACAKHFAVHSGPEKGRHSFNAEVSEKDLVETYLPAFEKCVRKAKVEAVMGAYNAVNGTPACCNEYLLTEILRKKWGFEGHVVSDCGAIFDISENHKYAPNKTEAAALSIKAGCDLNCGTVYENLVDAYETDLIDEDDIDIALKRTLNARFKLGMFDEKTEYDEISSDVIACEEHRELSLKAASESIVMLKNDGILPLNKNIGKIAVIGPNGNSQSVLLGNYNGTPVEYHTVYKGMCDYLGTDNVGYEQGSDYFESDENLLSKAVALAENSDIALLCLGYTADFEGEEGDANNPYCAGDRIKIELPDCQMKLLDAVKEVNDNIIILMFCGGGVALGEAKDKARGIFHCFYPGEMGGAAIARLLFGEYNPSGKLPITFYSSTDDLPDFEDYSMKNRTYRYFRGQPEYPFGFGLSYTKFVSDIENIEVSGDELKVIIGVENVGERAGKEVVMLFKSEKDAVNQPIKSLTRFKKIHLEPKQKTLVEFILNKEDFSHIDENGERVFLDKDKFDLFLNLN
ncbi:MAG TPA: glycoside hydrolase family 3 protein [Clostridiales bacterium]|nr:glycoside hydrolase family 3 protein [Clostridiales bacterium]